MNIILDNTIFLYLNYRTQVHSVRLISLLRHFLFVCFLKPNVDFFFACYFSCDVICDIIFQNQFHTFGAFMDGIGDDHNVDDHV